MTRSALEALTPEARLLLLAAVETPDDGAFRALLAGPVEWPRLAQLAHREQAVPVLWSQLRRFTDAMPAADAEQFGRLAQITEFRLLQLQHRFEQSVAALAAGGVDVVLLKGAGLAYTAYRSFSARPMSDVDLLLRPDEGATAQALLAQIGWDWERRPELDAFYAHHHHLPPLYDTRGGGASLELHTALFIAGHPLGLTAESVWADVRPLQIAGAAAYVPSPNHQMLHACLHFAWGHTMESGAWRTFRDVAAIAASGGVDWEAFVALAEATRGGSCCYWTFELARTLTGTTSVPDWVLERLRPPVPRLVHERLRRHLAQYAFGVTGDESNASVKLTRFMWEAAILPQHYGHGAVRPWAQDERWLTASQPVVAAPRRGRFLARLRSLGAYTRYLRTILSR